MKFLGIMTSSAMFLLFGWIGIAAAHQDQPEKPPDLVDFGGPPNQEQQKPAEPAQQEHPAPPAKASQPAHQQEPKPAPAPKQEQHAKTPTAPQEHTQHAAKAQQPPAEKQQQAKTQQKQEPKQQQHATQPVKAQEEQSQKQPQHAQQQAKDQPKQQEQRSQQGKTGQNNQQSSASSHAPQRTQQATATQHAQPELRLSGRGSGRIPDDRFHSNFGRGHAFRMGNPVLVDGYSRFQYGGYWFGYVQPWPSDWYYTDQFYIDYVDGGYYMYDPYYPGSRFAITVVL